MSHATALKLAVARVEELATALAPQLELPSAQRRVLLAILVTEAITAYQEARMLQEEVRSL